MTLVRASTVALAAALALAGCNRTDDGEDGNATAAMALPDLPATLPLEAGPAQEVGYAPSASDLPDTAPLKLAQVADSSEAYGYADAAYAYDEAIGDAPPDYAFDYDDTDPWAWQGYDGSTMYAEPIDDGYRHYYYRPGEDSPYFVRDPYYSYGFAGGLLAAVYALDGAIVPYADYGPRLVYASRYFARGRDLYRLGRRAARRPVVAAVWVQRRPVILTARQRWGAGRVRQPLWASYHRANQPRLARYWQPERVRRAADAERFAGWRQAGFRTPAPARAIPAAWQGQRWARDERRYRPASDAVRERVTRQERRDDRQVPLVERRQDQRQDRREEARQDRREDIRQDRRQDVRQERRQEAREERRGQAEARQQAARRDEARERQQAQRQAAQLRREQARDQRQGAQGREAAQARREQAQQERQVAQGRREEARQRQPQAERPVRERPERQPAAERGQAERQQRQEQQRAERQQRQRDQVERVQRDRDGAERQQRQAQVQAERQQRQQQMQAERQQRQQQAPQQRAEQRQAAPAQRQQAQEQRQQAREQRQQNRAERREGRGGRD